MCFEISVFLYGYSMVPLKQQSLESWHRDVGSKLIHIRSLPKVKSVNMGYQ